MRLIKILNSTNCRKEGSPNMWSTTITSAVPRPWYGYGCGLRGCDREATDRIGSTSRNNIDHHFSVFKPLRQNCSEKVESQNQQTRNSSLLPQLSGEIVKEPFLDILLTDLEQTAFSLSSWSQDNSIYYYKNLLKKLKAEGVHTNSRNRSYFAEKSNSILNTPQQADTALDRSCILNEGGKSDKKMRFHVKVGDFVHCGDKIGEYLGRAFVVTASGRIIRISESQVLLQKTQPVLYYSQANVHVQKGEFVEKNAPILTLTHQTLITGDIVQGIPRIEQLFEAPMSAPSGLKKTGHMFETLHSQVREIFRQNWMKYPLPAAVRESLQQIQQILVESIQKVYLSQGVLIADKHLEIIVRQMTSKAQVLDSGDTGLLLEELLSVHKIEKTHLAVPGRKALYAPAVVGLTRSALESDSFISAASFQETTRVLSRDATIGKTDFLRGLKEKVVIGDLISAGTGLDAYFVYTLLSPISLANKGERRNFLSESTSSQIRI